MRKNFHQGEEVENEHGACCTQIEHLSVKIGEKWILKDINLHTHCGELTAIIGPNGGGKSTLMKAIVGEIPHRGRIHFLSASGEKIEKPRMGYVPQTPRFERQYPVSVRDLFVAATTKYPAFFPTPKSIREQIRKTLQGMGMEQHMDKKVGVLSGGELQRILLTLALHPTPQILLMDEPANGIDVKGLRMFYERIEDVKRNYDLTVLVVSHDRNFVRQYADHVVLINQKVVAFGSAEDVLNSKAYHELLG